MSCSECNLTSENDDLICLKCENKQRWEELPVEHKMLIRTAEKTLNAKEKNADMLTQYIDIYSRLQVLGIEDITVPNNL